MCGSSFREDTAARLREIAALQAETRIQQALDSERRRAKPHRVAVDFDRLWAEWAATHPEPAPEVLSQQDLRLNPALSL
jgi:hypothetical protein